MDLEPDSTSITVAREVVAANDENLLPRRVREISTEPDAPRDYRRCDRASDRDCWQWPADDDHASRNTGQGTREPIEDDDKGLLLAMGKQIEELHVAIKIMFDAWKKSETLNQNLEAELRVVTTELQTVKSELQAVKGELQAMKERVEDGSA
ncbi:hypothetical protein CABS01_16623 [Colletotrichum abscissum]|uniref:uncharacterized protein n=1 Tax=Colletotrichum abscissum TaxID=1671311 RepID=UPI0027D55B5F|nr:uncharacterized protein CABS01_16623 [Colletotrichum abscissum]KAK1519064.1 hypothetical protein CABS01_16623 [Colletotrichum abscissum]